MTNRCAERLHDFREQIGTYGVAFVGHSMGGLVVRRCVNAASEWLWKR